MNIAKYFATLTAIVLATGFSQPLTYAQAPQFVLTSIFNDEPSPPPDRGAPGDRKGAGTHAAQHLWLNQKTHSEPRTL